MRFFSTVLMGILLFTAIPPSTSHADVQKPEEGYNVIKTLFYIPVALIQFIAFDIPRSIGAPFRSENKFHKKYSAATSNPDWKKRLEAVEKLGGESTDLRYRYLLDALSDHQVIVSLTARDLLIKSDKEEVFPLLLKKLESRDPWTRMLVAQIFEIYDTPEVIKQLVFLTNDYNREVKIASLDALEKISDEPLLLKYYPHETKNTSDNNITHWWYMRGKVINTPESE